MWRLRAEEREAEEVLAAHTTIEMRASNSFPNISLTEKPTSVSHLSLEWSVNVNHNFSTNYKSRMALYKVVGPFAVLFR